ncbi:MAG: hypothetical protein WCR30_04760 [Clostridia bacterium]
MGILIDRYSCDVKTWDVFSVGSFARILDVQRFLSTYVLEFQESSMETRTFYDSPNALLEKAGISICKVIGKDYSYVKIEKENYLPTQSKIRIEADKTFIQEIKPKDYLTDHNIELSRGIALMFSTNLPIDLDHVIKVLIPKIQATVKRRIYKIFSGNGFKAEMRFEDILFKNNDTRKSATALMLKIELKSPATFREQFADLCLKFEKYCKEIAENNQSKFQVAKRLTK